MSPKERNIPGGQSPFGNPPVLRPSADPLKVGDKATAPRKQREQSQATKQPAAGRRSAPRTADAVALTVRVDPMEADEVDMLILELRRETGRRVDKAEVIRELLRMASEHNPSRAALVKRLKP